MGGKTQPRVAGNVKPSSSGRIRELLVNTNGAGAFVTFSALSNSQPPPQPRQQQPKQAQIEDKSKISSKTDTTLEEPIQSQKTPVKEKQALVIKRVGDRDYFTRVRIPDGQATNTSGRDQTVGNVCLIGGTNTSNPQDQSTLDELEREEEKSSEQKNVADGKVDSANDASIHGVVEVPDFDTILDDLARLKESSGAIIESADDLQEDVAARECELLKLLRIAVGEYKEDLSIEEWDLVVGSIYKWVSWITKSQNVPDFSFRTRFCADVIDFIHDLASLAYSLEDKEGLDDEHPMLKTVLDDWKNLYSSHLFVDLVTFYLKLISKNSNLTHNDERLVLIESVAQIVVEVDAKMFMSNLYLLDNLDTKIEFDTELEMPNNLKHCDIDASKFKRFVGICGLLKSNHRIILIPAHIMLSQTMGKICETLGHSSFGEDPDNLDGTLLLPPTALTAILLSRDSMMAALLSDYRAGDISVTMEPNTDSYGCTLAYLFVWDLVVQFIVGLDKELGHRIIHSLKKLGLIQRLLDNLFMLLPPLGSRDSLNLRMITMQVKGSQEHYTLNEFLKSPLRSSIKQSANEIELTALHIYFSVALHMPVTVRKWFNNNSNKRLCNLVNEYTVKHISQVICSLEMDSVSEECQKRASKDESNNLVIKARPSAKEVYAIYTRDEFKMELTIKLPNNYPLGPVQIDGGKRVGVTDLKWRSWLLQLTTFLAHQNGPILDGIDLWRRNIDKRFEGIEKCTICFSILHSNYQLPKKKCQTCTKMFHNLCLYKWFESSGNSTCPLCRNPW